MTVKFKVARLQDPFKICFFNDTFRRDLPQCSQVQSVPWDDFKWFLNCNSVETFLEHWRTFQSGFWYDFFEHDSSKVHSFIDAFRALPPFPTLHGLELQAKVLVTVDLA
jgi:hypothetical protein